MEVKLAIIAGPHAGKVFCFDRHDTFLVGRVEDAHWRLSYDDPYFSRRQFVLEVNPPRCRIFDLKSRNGTYVNGKRINAADLSHGDEISAGHTTFKVMISPVIDPAVEVTLDLPSGAIPAGHTIDYTPPMDFPKPHAAMHVPPIPGYSIEAELGRGAMGVVCRAVRHSDGATVALKMILPASGVSRKQIDRFIRECRILSELSHPNIVGFLGVEEAEGSICLVMEHVSGPDAGKLLAERGPWEVKRAVRLTCQILGGLGQAHAMGFVHRDIKPSNILIARHGDRKRKGKLADFGLARVVEASKLSGLTMQGEVGGTPAFMAPEQVTHFRDAKPATDQYSMAATLYKLLSGRPPHDLPRGVPAQLIHIATEPTIPLGDRGAEIPRDLCAAIHKALAREPKDRFADVLEFRKELLQHA